MNAPDVEEVIARSVALLRKAKGWSQAELAKRAGIDQKTVSNLEAPSKGREAPSPTVATLSGVAKSLGVKPWQLVCGQDWCLRGETSEIEGLVSKIASANAATQDYIHLVLQRESSH